MDIALTYIGRLYEHEAYLRDEALSGQEKLAYQIEDEDLREILRIVRSLAPPK